MSNRARYPDDWAEWKDHPDSPEAKRPIPPPVELSNREKALLDIAYRAGYAQGHWNATKGIRAGIDGVTYRWIEEACVNGELEDLPCV